MKEIKIKIPQKELNITILSITLRTFWFFYLHRWKVTYEINGKIYIKNCWASHSEPKISQIIWDLKRKITL